MIYNHQTNTYEETDDSDSKTEIYKFILSKLKSKDKEILLSGCAGTGKTTLVSNLITTYGVDKFVITAVSHKAVNVLKKKVMDQLLTNGSDIDYDVSEVLVTKTITSLLDKKPVYNKDGSISFEYTGSKSKFFKSKYSNKIIVIDEYSMIDDIVYLELKKFANFYNCRLFFVGDKYQCPPPNDNSFTFYDKIGLKFELKKPVRYSGLIQDVALIVRDAIESEISPTDLISKIKKVVEDSKEENKSVTLYESKKDFIENCISEFKINKEYMSVLCYKNETVANINNYIKSNVRKIDTDFVKEFTTDTGSFCVDDEIILDTSRVFSSSTYRSDTFDNLEITSFYENYLTFCIINNKLMMEPESYFYEIERNINNINVQAVALIKCYYANYRIKRSNGLSGSVKVIDKNYIKIYDDIKTYFKKLKNKNKYDKNTNYEIALFFNAFDRIVDSYCVNVYKAQGSTYDNVYVYLDDILSVKPISLKEKYRAFYTAITRASKKVNILI